MRRTPGYVVIASVVLGFVSAVAYALTAVPAAATSVIADGTPNGGPPRAVVVTAVPLLVNEMQATLPFLKQDFDPNGVLSGKEVFGYYPSTVILNQGDTIQLSVVNPTGDDHTFTSADLGVNLAVAAQSTAQVTFTANRAGAFDFICAIPEHVPYMRGTVVVMAGGNGSAAAGNELATTER
jgi:plastocyanin